MAHKREFLKETVLTVQEGLEKIRANVPEEKTTQGYGVKKSYIVSKGFIWLVVQNKKGIRFQLGGHVDTNDQLVIKVYIPVFTNGKVTCHVNDYIHSDYGITFYEKEGWDATIEFATDTVFVEDALKTLEEFIEYIDNKDWINNPVTIDHSERYIVETHAVLKKL